MGRAISSWLLGAALLATADGLVASPRYAPQLRTPPAALAHVAAVHLAPAARPVALARPVAAARGVEVRMAVKESVTRSAVKAIGWRFTAGIVTAITSYFFTKSLAAAAAIVGWDLCSKSVTMFIGERLWNKSDWGKDTAAKGADDAKRSLVKELHLRKTAIFNELIEKGEIPLRAGDYDTPGINNPAYWDVIAIALPAFACGTDDDGYIQDELDCLTDDGKQHLDDTLDNYISNGALMTGLENAASRPGSAVAFVRQNPDYLRKKKDWDSTLGWTREFYCQNAATNKYKIVYDKDTDACYLDYV